MNAFNVVGPITVSAEYPDRASSSSFSSVLDSPRVGPSLNRGSDAYPEYVNGPLE